LAYLFSIRSNSQINISKGTATHSLGDAVFLLTKKREEEDKEGGSRGWLGWIVSMVIARTTPRAERTEIEDCMVSAAPVFD